MALADGADLPAAGRARHAPKNKWRLGVHSWRLGGFSVLPVTSELTSDLTLVLEVNMHESFRWMDEPTAGFTDGVFDATPTTFEPVLQFGANSFALTVE